MLSNSDDEGRVGIKRLITRNQFVPKAHEGSNPSLCARRFNLTHSGWIEPFLLAHRKWILTMRRTSQGSHLSAAIGELAHQWRSDKSSPLVNIPRHNVFGTVGRSRTLHRKVRGYSYVSVGHDTLRWIRHPYSRMLHIPRSREELARKQQACVYSHSEYPSLCAKRNVIRTELRSLFLCKN